MGQFKKDPTQLKKIHTIEGVEIVTKTERFEGYPLSYKIQALHPEGAIHEQSLTFGDAELQSMPNPVVVQKTLDDARENAAQMAHKKAALDKIAAQLT